MKPDSLASLIHYVSQHEIQFGFRPHSLSLPVEAFKTLSDSLIRHSMGLYSTNANMLPVTVYGVRIECEDNYRKQQASLGNELR